jgi:glycosyltransferase involved in cell wall biosynthesis
MHVWIDGQCLQTTSVERGIGRYVYNLIKSLSQHPDRLKISVSLNAEMADEFISSAESLRSLNAGIEIHAWQGIASQGEVQAGYSENRQLSEIALSHHVACLKPDIALSTSIFEGAVDRAVPLLSIPGNLFPICGIFYDAIPNEFPSEYLQNRNVKDYYYRRLEKYANFDALLAISQFAAQQAKELFPELSIYQIDAGLSDTFLDRAEPDKRDLLDSGQIVETYVLYVGSLDWRKNVARVADAFSLLPSNLKRNLKFVVAGAYDGFNAGELKKRWVSVGLNTKNLLMLGRVSDTRLIQLYTEANLTIQPSIMEGFGLTVLESIMCGTPVIGSSTGALPEVLHDSRAMFDPLNSKEIAQRISEFIGDKVFSKAVADIQCSHASKFTWSRSSDLAIESMRVTIEKSRSRYGRHDSNSIPELNILRELSLLSLGKELIKKANVAKLMATSEPVKHRKKKLYVDVTVTYQTTYTSGIQRVVRKIASSLTSVNFPNGAFEAILWISEKRKKVDKASVSEDELFYVDKNHIGAKLTFSKSDVLLMLDSSWNYLDPHVFLQKKALIAGAQVISCLYDTVPIKVPAMCYVGTSLVYTVWLESALSISTGFVCISKSVADELLVLLKAINYPRRLKIGFWPLGADFKPSTAELLKIESVRNEFYSFLMVGTLEPRKNHMIVLEAFTELWKLGFSGILNVVGRRGWNDEDIVKKIKTHPELGRKLTWSYNANDVTLTGFYNSSDVLIAASHAEGFGLPIVEGLQRGCQVLASDIPVFREVAGNSRAVRYFVPDSVQSLMQQILSTKHVPPTDQMHENSTWVDWNESTRRLAEVVIDGHWYTEYIPSDPITPISKGIGNTSISRKLVGDETRHKIEVIGPVAHLNSGKSLKYTVKVTNLSADIFSSRGASDGLLGIYLSYHILSDKGEMLKFDNPRSAIPFVIPPNDSVYLAVDIDVKNLPKTASYIDLELLQETVGWWGNALRVALPHNR